MAKAGSVSIIIPTYNEADNIEATLRRVIAALSALETESEILVVDDNSADRTAEIAENSLGRAAGRVIRRITAPRSLSLSVLETLAGARGDIIIVMDGDGSHPPELIPSFLNNLEEGYDLVVGSRYIKGGGTLNFPFSRKVISHFACILGRLLTKINDNTSGFFAIRRSCLEGTRLNPCGFKVGLEIFVKARISSYKEIPYIFTNRQKGKSKLRPGVTAQYLRHFLKLLIYKLIKMVAVQFKKVIDGIVLGYLYFYIGLFITDYSFVTLLLKPRLGLPFSRVSNITGPTIGLLFLLFGRYLIDKNSFMTSPLARRFRIIAGLSDKKLLFFSISAVFIIFASLSIARHLALSSGAWDLGLFDQAVWNTARGDVLFSSLKYNMNLLGDHFEPILLFIAPLYMLWSSAAVLLLLQSLILALAIIPLYLIARGILEERLLVFVFIFSYILSRPLRGIALFDFHPECFILFFLFWAYYFLINRRDLLLLLALFFLLLCKEDTAFLVSGLGIFAYFFQKRRILGVLLFITGIAAWIFTTRIAIPYFNPQHQYYYMKRLPFGGTYQDNLRSIIRDPSLLKHFIIKDKIEYCVKLFAPLGFLSILSPSHYILIFIPLFRNLIPAKEFSGWYQIASFYTAGVIPFIYISAISGAGWLIKKIGYRKIYLPLSILVIFLSLVSYGKTDGYKFSRFLATVKNNRTLEKLSYLKIIPRDASVAANFNLVPHLSQRKYIFEWVPHSRIDGITDYIVIDTTLLEYLCRDADAVNKEIRRSFKGFLDNGYKLVFLSPDKTFFIFYNPDIDKSLVEGLSSTAS